MNRRYIGKTKRRTRNRTWGFDIVAVLGLLAALGMIAILHITQIETAMNLGNDSVAARPICED